jgi:citrate lyase subunit beta/citryl-CoA lyase
VAGAGNKLDCIMIPKPESAHHVQFVEDLVRMVENDNGISKPIGFELIIEAASALTYLDEIATASDRTETLIFGYADMSASLGLPAIPAGSPMPGYPGDHLHAGLFQVIVAARTFGLQAIDGPFVAIQDIDGLKERALKSKGLGYEGKWALHPGQIETLHEVFTPTQAEYDKAEAVIEKYNKAKSEGLGAIMFGKDMLDEAVLKQATVVAGRGQASGLKPEKTLADFDAEYEQMIKEKAGNK